jgi:hypothetical protein
MVTGLAKYQPFTGHMITASLVMKLILLCKQLPHSETIMSSNMPHDFEGNEEAELIQK